MGLNLCKRVMEKCVSDRERISQPWREIKKHENCALHGRDGAESVKRRELGAKTEGEQEKRKMEKGWEERKGKAEEKGEMERSEREKKGELAEGSEEGNGKEEEIKERRYGVRGRKGKREMKETRGQRWWSSSLSLEERFDLQLESQKTSKQQHYKGTKQLMPTKH